MSEKPTAVIESGAPVAEAADSWAGKLERDLQMNRSAVKETLSPDVIRLAESLGLEKGFANEIEGQRDENLIRPCELLPDFDQVLGAFTPEMLVAAQDFQDPVFVMGSKGRSFSDLIATANQNKRGLLQRDAYIDEIFVNHAGNQASNWSAHIVEGADRIKTMDFHNVYGQLGWRVDRFNEYKKSNGVNGMDRWLYLALMMNRMRKGQPIDTNSYTMLDSDPALTPVHIPYAFWNGKVPWNRRIFFEWQNADKRETEFHFRRSVGGEVKM